jgi:phosphate transport system substrate-binding protein
MNTTRTLATVAALAGAAVASVALAVTIKGSDTMLILNQRLAEAYASQGGADNVAVTGGGSSIGINAFINGVTDICASSRPIRKSEIDRAKSRGSVAWEIPIALDGLAIVVNANNKVESLDMEQLRRIYIGQVTNWKQVGGADMPIVVFSRDSNSGTYGFFQQNVLKNQNWGRSVRFMPSTSEEGREVGRTAGGIGYGGVAYFKGNTKVRIVPIAPKAGAAPVAPTEDNVRTKKYPIWRYLYYYTNGRPKGDVEKFVRFVEEVGYYSLKG